MNILIVVGARPNFMKAAPIIAAIQQHNRTIPAALNSPQLGPHEPIHCTLVHTGQHYDDRMSEAFFRDLRIPKPDVYLGVGSGSHAVQTAEVMKKFEPVVAAEKPDMVLVVGDVNSTVACALVTAKMALGPTASRPLLVHVEAGLRSFDRSMPEEINRLLTDQISDVLFVTEESGVQNLRDEGIAPYKIHFVGNTMIDSLLAFQEKAERSAILTQLGLLAQTIPGGPASLLSAPPEAAGPGADARAGLLQSMGSPARPYALLTLHRPSNVDERSALLNIMDGLEELAANIPVIFPVHPRTRARMEEFGLGSRASAAEPAPGAGRETPRRGILLTDPLGYLDFVCLMKHAVIVVTDSGGVQEETTCLGVPCVTLRNNTERPVTIEKGTNVLAGTHRERIKNAIRRQMAIKPSVRRFPEKWDGQAATRIISTLVNLHRHAEENAPRQAISA